jgi:Cof subfamily protein (haloacid dehalogenase superfamily)
MIKLLCIDMDGTLLNSDKQISERTLKAIKAASEKGVKIVICTGRVYTSADFYSKLIGVKAPVIASNGAYIREKDKEEVIYRGLLGIDNCKKTLSVCKKYGLHAHYNTSNTIFTEEIIYSSEYYTELNKTLPEGNKISIQLVENWENTFELYKDEILKCIVQDIDDNKVQAAKAELQEIESLTVVSSFDKNFEVMSKGVSKGRAVEILSEYYGILREEIMCIGDNDNDMSMIKFAGTGVAMGNGIESIKEIASFVTDTNDNHGVAKAIEKFIL